MSLVQGNGMPEEGSAAETTHVPPPPPAIFNFDALEASEAVKRARQRRFAWVVGTLCTLFALIVGIWAGRAVLRASRESDRLMAQLHEAMRRQSWNEIYNGSDRAYRSETTSSDFEQMFAGVQRKLGDPISTERVNLNAVANSSGATIRAVYDTKFSKDAEATETVVWRKTLGDYALESYNIESKQLILR